MIIFSLVVSLIFSLHAMEENKQEKPIQFNECIAKSYKAEIDGKVKYLKQTDKDNQMLPLYEIVLERISGERGILALAEDYKAHIDVLRSLLEGESEYNKLLNEAMKSTKTAMNTWQNFRIRSAYLLEAIVKPLTSIHFPDHTGKSQEEWVKDFFEANKNVKVGTVDYYVAASLVLFQNRQIQYDGIHKELPEFMKDGNTNQ